MSPFPHHNRQHWARTLTRTQIATVKRIRQRASGVEHNVGSSGWTVFVTPSTGPAHYLELRHYMGSGGIARWVIERDGSVSAHNDQGASRELVTGRGNT